MIVLPDGARTLSRNALYVLTHLQTDFGGRAHSIDRLVMACHLSRPTVRSGIDELLQKRFIAALFGSMGRIEIFVCDEVPPVESNP
jgi:hypothetical protein